MPIILHILIRGVLQHNVLQDFPCFEYPDKLSPMPFLSNVSLWNMLVVPYCHTVFLNLFTKVADF